MLDSLVYISDSDAHHIVRFVRIGCFVIMYIQLFVFHFFDNTIHIPLEIYIKQILVYQQIVGALHGNCLKLSHFDWTITAS